MFDQLSNIFHKKLKYENDLSRHLEIVKVFDFYKEELARTFSDQELPNPISLKNGLLTVQTKSASQTANLRLYEAEIIEQINKKFGQVTLKKILYRF